MKAGMLGGLLFALVSLPAAAQVDLEPYLKDDPYQALKISPDGQYFATTAPLEDREALVVVRRSDRTVTAKVVGRRDSVVDNFWWANDERVVVSMANKLGSRDRPMPIGQLHAINADGSKGRLLASPYGIAEEGSSIASAEPPRAVFLEDTLPQDERNVLVSSMPFSNEPYIRLEKLDIYTRRRSDVASAPVRRAQFLVDAQAQARFAWGADTDNASRLYYRDNNDAQWRLVNDENTSRRVEWPLGFSADGRIAYVQVQQASGPDRIMAWDPATGEYALALADDTVDPYAILYDLDNRTPIGASFMSDRVRNRFFDEKSPTARLYRSLERAFTDEAIYITSVTADKRLAVVYAWSDRNAGDYFLFDLVNKQADRLFGRREWFLPAQMSPTRAVSLKARDGVMLHGYLTTPKAAKGPLPMVVMPHGGPFGVFDEWRFDDDAQILAEAGYAVLRINYRGSGNYGRAFMQSGAQEWGGRMQDDLTDATRWAGVEGIADPKRICLYGASYGGYASLMGVAKEPDLYRCAAGYVGVYDLRLKHRRDSNNSRSGRTWAGEWMGEADSLAERSPVTLADRIQVPVFLAAGGKDERAPVAHTEKMEKALKNAGVPVESLYFPTEGHGFYTREHRREYYRRLLGFLSKHLGGQPAK